jgi:hypothetical protein
MIEILLLIVLAVIVLMTQLSEGEKHEWYTWAESAAKTGYTGITSDVGFPDVYTQAGDTITLRGPAYGTPYFVGGFTMGVTKTGGGRIRGNLSYGTQHSYVPGIRDGGDPGVGFNLPAQQFEPEEIITAEADSAAVNEVTLLAALFTYGAPHKYPESFQEILAMLDGEPKEIWTPEFTVTSAGAVTAGSGSVSLEAASQEDLWIKKLKEYYILGVIPHLVDNNGLLQFTTNLPLQDLAANYIPLTMGAETVTFGSGVPCFPYEPIGPFTMASQPKVGLYSTIATATTFTLVIAKM